MRSQLVTLAAVLLLSCASATLFDDNLREIVEFLRLQMKCGYPPAGIPQLAPYQTEFKQFDLRNNDWDIHGNFSAFTITGLDEFDVRVLYFNNLLRKVTFDLNFEQILAKGDYKLDMFTRLLGPMVHIFGAGDMSLDLKNLRAYGSFRFEPTFSGGVQIFGFKLKLELEAVHSAFTGVQNSKLLTKVFNSWLEEFIQLGINDNSDQISATLEALIVPPLNQAMKNMSAAELIGFILGLGGDIIPNEAFC